MVARAGAHPKLILTLFLTITLTLTLGQGDVYGWSHVEPNDRKRASIFDAVLGPKRVHYLDAAAISNRRADRHLVWRLKLNISGRPPTFDCLHYCLPGPPDDVPVLGLQPRTSRVPWYSSLLPSLLSFLSLTSPRFGSRPTVEI